MLEVVFLYEKAGNILKKTTGQFFLNGYLI